MIIVIVIIIATHVGSRVIMINIVNVHVIMNIIIFQEIPKSQKPKTRWQQHMATNREKIYKKERRNNFNRN